MPLTSTSFMPIMNTIAESTAFGRKLSGLEKEEHNQHDSGRREMSYLASTTCFINHFSLGWTAINDEGAGNRSSSICRCKPNKVIILKKFLFVAHCIGARSCSALRDDNQETRCCARQH